MKNFKSLNGKFILEPYKQGQGLKGEIRGGIMMPRQKTSLVPLKLKAETTTDEGTFFPGNVAYVAEDLLMTSQWAKTVRTADGIDGEFIIVEKVYVTMVREQTLE